MRMTTTRSRWRVFAIGLLVVVVAVGVVTYRWNHSPDIGKVRDEALTVDRTATSFPAADEDYFHDMDGGVPLSPEEVRGRNTWTVWTGGNDRFWDEIGTTAFGALDFLKTVSSHPSLKANRDHRWEYLGLVNEPCFVKAAGPDPKRHGLWLDQRSPN